MSWSRRFLIFWLMTLLIWIAIPIVVTRAMGTLTVSGVTVTESNTGASTESSSINFIISGVAAADVTINYSNNGECTLRDSGGSYKTSGSLTLASGNSSVSSVVRAINDEDIEGQHACDFSFHTASADSQFNGINKVYSATIQDNDGLPSLNIVVTEASHLKEGNLSFRNVYSIIRGDEEPTADITVTVWTDNQCALRKTSGEGYTSQISQKVQNYAVPIIVVANDDEKAEGDHTCHVQHLIHTSDPAYKDNLVDSRFITIEDNEAAPPASTNQEESTEEVTAATEPTDDGDEPQEFVGQAGGEPIRLRDPDAVSNLFIIMTVSAVIVGTILGWWRYSSMASRRASVDKP